MEVTELAAASFFAVDVPAFIGSAPAGTLDPVLVLHVNGAFERATGLSRADAVGAPPPAGFVVAPLPAATCPEPDSAGDVHVVGVWSSDVVHPAGRDPLTGLPDRTELTRVLDRELRRCAPDCTLAVIFVDINGFTRVNDSLGHLLGDQLLRDVALRLGSLLATRATVGRLSGDEFVVIVPDSDEAEVVRTTRAVSQVLERPFQANGVGGLISASQGVALVDGPGRRADEVLRDAETAMAEARTRSARSPGGQVVIFDEEMRAQLLHRIDLEHGLRRAVSRNELHLVYQPIVEITSGRAVSAEALVRWIRPRRGIVEPGRFIPVAEEAGLMVELGRWILDAAVAQAAEWDRGRRVVPVSVNVSAQQLLPTFPGEVAEVLARHDLPADRLVLEVTESAVMFDPETGIEVLSALRALGCRVAIDDFGTGHSSLAYLKRLPVNIVKLDRQFVADIADRNSPDRRIVEAILGLAEALGLIVVAEGIEMPEQAAALLAGGCQFGQGYLFSPPRDPFAMSRYFDQPAPRPPGVDAPN